MTVNKLQGNDVIKESKVTPLDEVELALGMLKIERPDLVEDKTYYQISKSLNERYQINSTEEDVFLLHEPTIDQMEEDLRIQFATIGLIY